MSGNDFQGLGTEAGNDIIATESGSGLVVDVVYPSFAKILEAVISRLHLDTDLMALVGNRVRNDLPQNSPLPYVRVRLGNGTEWDTKDSNGIRHEIVCDVWTDRRGDKQVHQIQDMIYRDLHDRPLTGLVAQSLILMVSGVPQTSVEPDGAHHGVITFSHTVTG